MQVKKEKKKKIFETTIGMDKAKYSTLLLLFNNYVEYVLIEIYYLEFIVISFNYTL